MIRYDIVNEDRTQIAKNLIMLYIYSPFSSALKFDPNHHEGSNSVYLPAAQNSILLEISIVI